MKRPILLSIAGLVVFGFITFASYGGDNVAIALHSASHKVGLCTTANAAPRFANADKNRW